MSRRAVRAAEATPAIPAGPALPVRLATLAVLLALVLVAFGGAVRNEWFAIDDNRYVLDNPHVRTGLTAANVGWELTHVDCGNWHPLTMVSHMLDVRLFGTRPAGHHAMSVGWHALDAILLLLVLYGFTGAWWRSACVAALFALHPLRVESVAWVAERKDVLSTCFFLLTLDAWRRWTRDPSRARYALVCAWLTLGLLAKPMLVTAPFVLLLLDAWPLRRLEFAPGAAARGHGLAARLREKWPLWLLVAVFSVATLRAQGSAGALVLIPGLTPWLRASNALRTFWIYAGQTVWPHDLVAFVPHDLEPHTPAAIASLLALVAVTIAVLRSGGRPWLVTGWFWWLGTLLPVINVVQVGPHARADRFTYLPGIGLAILVVWEVASRVERVRAARVAAIAAMLAAVTALTVATSRQVARWRDTRTMYEAILRAHPGPGSNVIRWGLADIDAAEGRTAEALAGYERVARDLHGNVLLDASVARAHADKALQLVNAGRAGEALAHFSRAVELAPANVEYRRAYAETLKRRGRYGDALAQYEAIVAANPADVNALLNAAWMRATLPDARLRDGAAAVRMAERALEAAPEPPAALVATAAAAYAEAGRWDDAIAASGHAVALARAAGSPAEAAQYAAQAALYRAHRPFRGTPQ